MLDVSVAGRLEVNVSTGYQFTVGSLEEMNLKHKSEVSTLKNQLTMMKNDLSVAKRAIGLLYEDHHAQIHLGS